MRSMFKRMPSALLVVLALGSIASATPAAATACTKHSGSKLYTLCVAGEQLGYPVETSAMPVASHIKSGTVAAFSGNSFGNYEALKCSTVNGTASIESGTSGKLNSAAVDVGSTELKFTNCETPGHSGCKVTEPIAFNLRTGQFTLTLEALPLETLLFNNKGLIVGHITISQRSGQSCPITLQGTREIRGSAFKGGPECTLHQPEAETLEKELTCQSEKSHLETTFENGVELGLTEVVSLSGTSSGKQFSFFER